MENRAENKQEKGEPFELISTEAGHVGGWKRLGKSEDAQSTQELRLRLASKARRKSESGRV